MKKIDQYKRVVDIQRLRANIEYLRQKNLYLLVQVDSLDQWIYDAVDKIQNYSDLKEAEHELKSNPENSEETLKKIAQIKRRGKIRRGKQSTKKIQKLKEMDLLKQKNKMKQDIPEQKLPKAEIIDEPILLNQSIDPFMNAANDQFFDELDTMLDMVKNEAVSMHHN